MPSTILPNLYYKLFFHILILLTIINIFKNIMNSMDGISGINLDLSMDNNDSLSYNPYVIKINSPQGQIHQPMTNTEKHLEADNRKISTKNIFSPNNTGYDINRQLFSDDDIRQAFNTIDINKDGSITEDQLSFFLKCMNQPHTAEEVKQMIKLVSSDGSRVILEDFKKIGRGKLPPFAAQKQPEVDNKTKQKSLQNIAESELSSHEPEYIMDLREDLQLTMEMFEQAKNKKKDYQELIFEPLVEQNGGMKVRSKSEIKAKREDFSKVIMFNTDKAIEALLTIKSEIAQLHLIAEALSLTQAQAKLLFERPRITVRQAIFDTILFSHCTNLKKIELILNNRPHGDHLTFQEWLEMLCFMMGSDQRSFIKKRLESILRHREKKVTAKFHRYYVLQIMNEEYNLFLW